MYKIIDNQNLKWVDVQNPTEEDITYLRENFAFHPLVLEELIPQVWRTKVEIFPTHLFVVVHFPLYNKESKETRPQELDIVITKDAIVTSHYHSIVPIKALFDKCNLYPDARKEYMSQNPGFLLYYILNEFWQSVLIKINHIGSKLDVLEEAIFANKESEMLKEISFAKVDIIDLLETISPQGEILESLTKQVVQFFNQDLEPYFSHLIGHWSQTKNDLLTYKETIRAYEETNNSLLSHKTNRAVQVLTTISAILLPLTLLASLFSMNVNDLPIVNTPHAFSIILILMLLLALGMLAYFKRKKWI